MQHIYEDLGVKTIFVDNLTTLISFLRNRAKSGLPTKGPLFVKTRWMSMARVTSWLHERSAAIHELFDGTNKKHKPPLWWCLLAGLNPIASCLENFMQKMQGHEVNFSFQRSELSKLEAELQHLIEIYFCS